MDRVTFLPEKLRRSQERPGPHFPANDIGPLVDEYRQVAVGLYPIAVGIDAIDGYVAVEGWGEVSSMKATDLAREFANAGVEAIICTDVGRDGMMTGVNIDFTLEIQKASGLETIASGGLKDMTDINALIKAGIDGTIVGKAFYEGTLDLEEAFKVANAR